MIHKVLPEGKCEIHLEREKIPMISLDKGVRKRMWRQQPRSEFYM